MGMRVLSNIIDTDNSYRHSHLPRKRFGQHFLCDAAVIERIIAEIGPSSSDRFLEIGPGLGALTHPLLAAVGEMDVVELDRDLLEPLRKYCTSVGSLRIHHADALNFKLSTLRSVIGEHLLRVVGNLPYNISTPLLFHLMKQIKHVVDMHFMLQQEVVARIVAGPGEEAYGRLSVMIQYRFLVKSLFKVSPESFRPIPKVWSTVIRLIPHKNLPVIVSDEQVFSDIVRQAFSQRRKTVRNSLRSLLKVAQIEAAGVDPSSRPETLNLAAFAALSQSCMIYSKEPHS
jgi:16S rRNA (adenine1518-N6/adenine1519-N6)-dimethyltransferase